MDENNQKDEFSNNPEVIHFAIKKMLEYAKIKPQSLDKIP